MGTLRTHRSAEAIRAHAKLKSADLKVAVRIWIDPVGKITRAKVQTTGDPAIDSALEHEALTGIQLPGLPPAGMLMPVNLKVTARRPD
jgi:hypothetical protein